MKTITKKLGNEVFVWDPNAYQGKGYWYILGKKGAYGRPASRKEVGQLGRPNQKETIPESPKVYEEPKGTSRSSEYRNAKRVGKTPLGELIFEKLFVEKQSLGSAVKGSISDKFESKVAGIKERFDPLNISKKLLGRKLTFLLGTSLGANKDDVEHFTGYRKKTSATPVSSKTNPDKFKKIEDASKTKVSAGGESRIKNKDGLADVLAKMYNLIKKNLDDEKKHRQLENNFKKQKEKEKDKWNQELIEAITGMKTKAGKSNATTKKTPKKGKSAGKSIKPEQLSEEGQQLYELTEGVGEAVAGIGEALEMGSIVAGMSELFPAAAGIAAIALGAYGLKKLIDNTPNEPAVITSERSNTSVAKDYSTDKPIPRPDETKDNLAAQRWDSKYAKVRDPKTGELLPEAKAAYEKNKNIKQKKLENDVAVTQDTEDAAMGQSMAKLTNEPKTKSASKVISDKDVTMGKKIVENTTEVKPVSEKSISPKEQPKESKGSSSSISSISPPKNESKSSSSSVSSVTPVISPKEQPEESKVSSVTPMQSSKTSLEPTVNPLSAQMQAVTNVYTDNKTMANGGGSALIADNSQDITIINNNTDGMMVEKLVAVREYESSFEKTIKQNLRMV
jgi:hypothetical protein